MGEQHTRARYTKFRIMKRFRSLILTVCSLSMLFCGHAYAQVSESDIGSESGVNESISRLTSTFEVKRAVIGLLVIAAVSIIVFFFYWYKSAQMAKESYLEAIHSNNVAPIAIKQKSSLGSWATGPAKNHRNSKPFRKRFRT